MPIDHRYALMALLAPRNVRVRVQPDSGQPTTVSEILIMVGVLMLVAAVGLGFVLWLTKHERERGD
jgi:hypothetical protein